MAITSNLKGFKVVNGTTLIKETPVKEGGEGRYRFVQTRLSFNDHKSLTMIALDKDITLTALIREIIQKYLTKEKEN